MLELSRQTEHWSWGATGKHPCVRDYFTIGSNGPLFSCLATWVKDGYSRHSKKGADHKYISWRFWLQAGFENELAVGIIRESCDAIGRHFPLLIMGVGCLPGLQQRWSTLLHDCETTWVQIEQMAATSSPDLYSFAERLKNIRSPAQKVVEIIPKSQVIFNCELFTGESVGMIEISDENPSVHLQALYMALMSDNPSQLKGIFVGGSLNKLSFFWFRRPLAPDDFELLWSI